MKKVLLWLVPAVLFSCEKTEYFPDPANDTYSLQRITYHVAPGDRVETFVHPLHTLEYANQTGVVQQVIVDPLAGLSESSAFMSDDANAFAWLGGAVPTVAVPRQLIENGVIIVGEAKWPYRSEAMALSPTLNLRDTIAVPPNTQLRLAMNVYFNEFEVSYTATFEGQPTGAVAEVNGKWKGVVVAHVEKQMEFR